MLYRLRPATHPSPTGIIHPLQLCAAKPWPNAATGGPSWPGARPFLALVRGFRGAGDGIRTRDNLLGRQTAAMTDHDAPCQLVRTYAVFHPSSCAAMMVGDGP